MNEYISLNYWFFKFINWMTILEIIDNTDEKLKKALKMWTSSEYTEYDDYVSLSELVIHVEPIGGDLTNKFKKQIITFLSEEITREVIDADVMTDVYDHDSFSTSIINYFVNERLFDISVKFDISEIDEISECCDIDASLDSQNEFEMDGGNSNISDTHEIDDLFDRG